MRMLGARAGLPLFRWDLVYLGAQLLSDERPPVKALADDVHAALSKLAAQRAALEQCEDAVIIALALVSKRDKRRDALLIETGGVARAADKAAYATLFPKRSPSALARLGLAAESAEINRILGEIAKLPADHPVRAYEKRLTAAEHALKDAATQSDEAATALALQRSAIRRLKLELDQQRLKTHGQLMVLLTDKAETESFYRATMRPPGEEEASAPADEAPAAPPPPA